MRRLSPGRQHELISRIRFSNLDQSIGTPARFLDREGHVVDRRAARGAALVTAMVGMAVNDGADLEAVDGFAQTRAAQERERANGNRNRPGFTETRLRG